MKGYGVKIHHPMMTDEYQSLLKFLQGIIIFRTEDKMIGHQNSNADHTLDL
jgi:hypothetical protein